MAISLFILGLTFSVGITAKSVLRNMQDKVSISVYFNPNVSEDRIQEVKGEVESKKLEVKSVEYVSKEQAKNELIAMDPTIQKALDEVGDNPLLSSLVIKANNSDQYDLIAKVLQEQFKDEVSRVNYDKNRTLIERVNKIIQTAEKGGIVLGGLFILLSILITFNTVRITIYSHKQEFEIMRLVGASNIYVEMPFVFEGILYGILASVVSFALLAVSFWYFYSLNNNFFATTGLNAFSMSIIFLVMLLSGVFLGVISSSIAIRRYLKK